MASYPKLRIVFGDDKFFECDITGDVTFHMAELTDGGDPVPPPLPPVAKKMRVTNALGLNVRPTPSTSGDPIGNGLKDGQVIEVIADPSQIVRADNHDWIPLYSEFQRWVALARITPAKRYLVDVVDTPDPKPTPPKLEGGRGFNLRSFAHRSEAGEIAFLKQHGFNYVRLYAAKRGLSMVQCLDKVEARIEQLAAAGINPVLVLTDSLGDSSHNITEDVQWHIGPRGHLKIDWYKEQYKHTLRKWVDEACKRFKGDTGVLLSPMNESAVYGANKGQIGVSEYDTWTNAWADLVDVVDGRMFVVNDCISGGHYVPSGAVYTDVVFDHLTRVRYSMVVGHLYAEANHAPGQLFVYEDQWNQDKAIAKGLGLKVGLLESGVHWQNPNRVLVYDAFVERQKDCDLLLQWGVCVGDDTGDCDDYSLRAGRDAGNFAGMVEALRQ